MDQLSQEVAEIEDGGREWREGIEELGYERGSMIGKIQLERGFENFRSKGKKEKGN